MAVVEMLACPDRFWCQVCTPEPAPLQGNDAIMGVIKMAKEHSRATGHKSKGLIGHRIIVDRCKNCQSTGTVTVVQATLNRQGRATEVDIPCEDCFYDVGTSWR